VSLKQGQLTGEAFADYNGNGVIDPGEPGLSNVLVYLDLNNSGSYSMGDPSAVTDQNGNFSFPTLAPGTYTLREVPPPNMTLEAPGFTMVQVQNNSAASVNFGNMPMQATSQLNYISALYGQILDRAPDQAGLSGWQQFLAHGGALQSVAQGIWQSTEHLSQEVTGLYQKLLNRAPDSGGLISWVWAMQNNGLTLAGLESDILGSAEFQAQNPTNIAFVAALYREVLNRNPDAAGSATWVGRLNLGMTNAQVVQAFLTSDEFYLDNLSAYYLNFLHRVPDQSGEQAWLLSLRQGRTTLETVAVDFLSSAEFMAWGSQHG
jgi:Domain of unknown function (DUF4214)/SdrD B-like domain